MYIELKMLVYFMTIWNMLRPFGIFCVHLECFSPFWYVWTKKNLAVGISDPSLPVETDDGKTGYEDIGGRIRTRQSGSFVRFVGPGTDFMNVVKQPDSVEATK
jgi:hypothetical protein